MQDAAQGSASSQTNHMLAQPRKRKQTRICDPMKNIQNKLTCTQRLYNSLKLPYLVSNFAYELL